MVINLATIHSPSSFSFLCGVRKRKKHSGINPPDLRQKQHRNIYRIRGIFPVRDCSGSTFDHGKMTSVLLGLESKPTEIQISKLLILFLYVNKEWH